MTEEIEQGLFFTYRIGECVGSGLDLTMFPAFAKNKLNISTRQLALGFVVVCSLRRTHFCNISNTFWNKEFNLCSA